jgi:oligopeptidase B
MSETTPSARVRNPSLVPPVARREPASIHLHGHTLHDDYAWLRIKGSPEVTDYLQRENDYTAAAMHGTEALQTALYKEMLSHIRETDESVPYPDHGFFYFTSTLEGLQYPIHCRRAASAGAPEETLLDVNRLAEGESYMAVGDIAVSPNGNLLAYSTDNTGFRQYTLRIRNLLTGLDLPDTFVRVGSFTWAADSATLFFTTEDEQTKRHDKLFRHTLGEHTILTPDTAHLIHEEKDERFNLGVARTRDRKHILIESGSHTTNEWRFLPAAHPLADLTLIAPRLDEQEYYPDHRDGKFVIRTNDTSRNFRLVIAPAASPGREHWRELYKGADEVPLEDFDLFESFIVLSERKAGLPTLAVHPLSPDGDLGTPSNIAFPEPTYTAAPHTNREFDTTRFRYSYQSLVSPASVYEYDLATGVSTLLKQQDVPGGFDSANYASERLWIEALDGVKIPVSLVYRRDKFGKDGTNPLYLSGYGSYGYAFPVGFSPTRLPFLDRGVVMAYAHIRGGGELGDAWHDAGKMRVKMHTFTDFIAVAEALVHQGYGDPTRVAIEGGSAGGLLLGAVVNLRPDLFRAVLSHVPFVDVMNTMLDASLPLTVAEYEEWGNPNDPADFETMLAYSPYDNLRSADYPAMLVKTSLNDSQVMYWEPAKYVAKLRTLKRNDAPLLFHINMDAGHSGASGRYDYLKEIAFDYAFLLTELGVEA